MKKLALLFVFSFIFACNDSSPTGVSSKTQVPVQVQGASQSGPVISNNQSGQTSTGVNPSGGTALPSGPLADSSLSGTAVSGVAPALTP